MRDDRTVSVWRQRHRIRDDDVVLLCIELFHIHQEHWGGIRKHNMGWSDWRKSRKLTTYEGMPRKLRLEYAGAIYHVMNRGDRREKIFQESHQTEQVLRVNRAAPELDGSARA